MFNAECFVQKRITKQTLQRNEAHHIQKVRVKSSFTPWPIRFQFQEWLYKVQKTPECVSTDLILQSVCTQEADSLTQEEQIPCKLLLGQKKSWCEKLLTTLIPSNVLYYQQSSLK